MKVQERGQMVWSQADVARRFGVTRGRISQLVKAGRLDLVIVRGKHYVTDKSIQCYEEERWQLKLPDVEPGGAS